MRGRSVLVALAALASSASADLLSSLKTKVTVYNTEGQAAASIVGVMSRDGPSVNELGVVGKMVVSEPDIFACNGKVSTLSTLFKGLFMYTDGVRPIALIERSPPDTSGNNEQCTFEDKVRAVQSAGAAAAIIFDYKSEGPVFMSYSHPDGVTIPAVFISNEAGQALVEAIARTNDQVAPIVHLVSSPDTMSTAWAIINTMQFEYLSFTTGYTLLAIFIIPVAIYNLIKAVRRRRKVEALYSLMFANDELKAKLVELSASWMRPLPLPVGLAHKNKSWCQYLHRFLTVVLLCYLWQMMCSSMWFEQNPTSAGNESRSDALDWGVGMVMDSVVMACAILILRTLLGCAVCACRAACRSRRPTPTPTPPDAVGDHYVALAGSVNGPNEEEEDVKKPVVHAGIPLSLYELKAAQEPV